MKPLRTILLAAVLMACSREPAATGRAAAAITVPGAPGEFLQDLRPDGVALTARVEPAPENSDADRRITVTFRRDGVTVPWRLADEAVLDARFVPRHEGILALRADHTLVRLDAPDATPVVIDQHVDGPLSVDALGRFVAYVRGEVPEVRAYRAEIATGAVREVAPSLAPVWCPTLSADGAEVVLVASFEGAPALFRVPVGGAPARVAVPSGAALPSGPAAPVVYGDTLVFEDARGVRALSLRDGASRAIPGLRLPVLADGAILAQRVGDATRATALTTLQARDLEAR